MIERLILVSCERVLFISGSEYTFWMKPDDPDYVDKWNDRESAPSAAFAT